MNDPLHPIINDDENGQPPPVADIVAEMAHLLNLVVPADTDYEWTATRAEVNAFKDMFEDE